MKRKDFVIRLSALTVILLIGIWYVHGIGEVGKYTDFSIYTVFAFVGFSILMYYLGLKAAKSENKYMFNNLIMGNMLMKMIFCIVLILAYKAVYEVESRAFVIPFLVIYLSFTIFETYFLTKLAK